MDLGILTYPLIALVAGLVVIGVTVIWIYNRLVTLRNRLLNALSQIDVQLKRRFDLVPNLVEATRAYLVHEKSTLEEMARLRGQGGGEISKNPKDQKTPPTAAIQNDLALTRAMGRFTAVVESYPDLKANQTIADLMEDLSTVENRVAYARQAYNDAVMEYNQTREMFPAVLFASKMGFEQAWLWWVDAPSRNKPTLATL
ncbi:MAG: LemA family protein [Deltaproteobacteria bacterium]|nr:LemA family protein [Deltaproteobacteria bacterium]